MGRAARLRIQQWIQRDLRLVDAEGSLRLDGTKTNDAEYVALARILGCRLRLDGRLRRGASRFAGIIGPSEL